MPHDLSPSFLRSTKAGARTPATQAPGAAGPGRCSGAQRRPGREPRRHVGRTGRDGRGTRRSTKAGARTPATPCGPRRRRRRPDPLNEGRGANPGDTRQPSGSRAAARALNEGRGANPGDTIVGDQGQPHDRLRSTKAGARTPATQAPCPPAAPAADPLNEGRGANPGDTVESHLTAGAPHPLNEGRGANPGDTRRARPGPAGAPALNEGRGANPGDTRSARRGGIDDVRRSTKAGARTPATPPIGAVGAAGARSLNEGRGANPGDTRSARKSAAPTHAAQRRPGREPRRHRASPGALRRRRPRSTKAGARTPATLTGTRRWAARTVARSTKAGARTPATRRPAPTPAADRWRRSTKAGARTPATRRRRHRDPPVRMRSTKAGARTPATPGHH